MAMTPPASPTFVASEDAPHNSINNSTIHNNNSLKNSSSSSPQRDSILHNSTNTSTPTRGDMIKLRKSSSGELLFSSDHSNSKVKPRRKRMPSNGDSSLGGVSTSGGAGSLRPHFDLSASLFKRRGGLGWNADQNWILRWFTLHGPILCYYDSADMQHADPSRPRGRINLGKEETTVDMHLSNKAGAPTEFLVTINIYGLGGKRKWEMCCRSKEQQLEWFEAMRKFDGKSSSAFAEAADSFSRSPRKSKKRGKPAAPVTFLEETTRRFSFSRNTSDDEDATDADMDDEEREGEEPVLTGSAAVVAAMKTRAASLVALNVAAYLMRVGSKGIFWLALILSNAILVSSFAAANKRSKVERRRRRDGGSGDLKLIDSVLSNDSDEEKTPFSAILEGGKSIPRATPTKEELVKMIEESGGTTSAGAVRACATAEKEDYLHAPHTCWNVNAGLFNLRIGPNYKKNKEKAPSGPALYDFYAADLVRGKCRLKHASEGFRVPEVPGISDMDTGHPDVPPMIVVTASLPAEEPTLFGTEDGRSFIALIYLVISPKTIEELKDLENASPAVKLLVEWCSKSDKDDNMRGRFKAMCVLDDIESLGLPSFIVGYNGKPTLITKSGTWTRYDKYIEVAINVHIFCYLAKKGLFALQTKFPSFVLNIGFTIEGRDDSELPEVLLGGARMINLDLNKAVTPSALSNGSGGGGGGGNETT